MNRIFLIMASFMLFAPLSARAQSMDAKQLALAKNYVRHAGLDAMIEMQINEMRKHLPIQSSQLEHLAGVTYLKPYKTQIFRHVTMPGWSESVGKASGMSPWQVKSAMPKIMQVQSVNAACSVEFTRFLMQQGLKMKHNYYDTDGSFLFSTQVEGSDCP